MKKKLIKRIIIIISSFFIIIGLVIVVSAIKISNSEAYPLAKEYILSNKEIKDKVGIIKSFSNFPSGLIDKSNGLIKAQIETYVEGSKSSGKIIVIMEKETQETDWVYKNIYFQKDE